MRGTCFFASSKNGNLESNKNDMNSALSISKGLTFALVSATLIFGMGACEKDPVKSMPGPGEYLNSKVGSNWSYSTTGTSSSDSDGIVGFVSAPSQCSAVLCGLPL